MASWRPLGGHHPFDRAGATPFASIPSLPLGERWRSIDDIRRLSRRDGRACSPCWANGRPATDGSRTWPDNRANAYRRVSTSRTPRQPHRITVGPPDKQRPHAPRLQPGTCAWPGPTTTCPLPAGRVPHAAHRLDMRITPQIDGHGFAKAAGPSRRRLAAASRTCMRIRLHGNRRGSRRQDGRGRADHGEEHWRLRFALRPAYRLGRLGREPGLGRPQALCRRQHRRGLERAGRPRAGTRHRRGLVLARG